MISFKIIASAVVMAFIFRNHWHLRLNFVTNCINIGNKVLQGIYPITEITDTSDPFGLQLHRFIFNNFPIEKARIETTKTAQILVDDSVINITLFYPETSHTEILPAIVYYHGGGFVLGNIEQSEHISKGLAYHTGAVVVSVGYRLAPEHKFPTAHDDCLLATKWILERTEQYGIDIGRIAVAGDSAGGALAAYVATQLRSAICFQLLIYPLINYATLSESVLQYQDGPILTLPIMEWFKLRYFNSFSEMFSPKAVPLHPANSLANLPPALIITAEFDILRDEGELYAQRLKEAGNTVTFIRYNNTFHSFFAVSLLPHGTRALLEASDIVKKHFATVTTV